MRTAGLVALVCLLWLSAMGLPLDAQVINGETPYDDTLINRQTPTRETPGPATPHETTDRDPARRAPAQGGDRHD